MKYKLPNRINAFYSKYFLQSLLLFLNIAVCQSQVLKIATSNVWSGLDYKGTWKMGEYETAERREERFAILLDELRALNPDVIALQEVNPVESFTCRVAEELGYDYICQRANGGIKIGTVGLPTNLNEGLAILARKELTLKFEDVWDLSRSFGLFGNGISFHFSDNNIALVGKITVGSRQLVVVNTHLTAAVPDDSTNRLKLQQLPDNSKKYNEAAAELSTGAQMRLQETTLLSELIEEHYSDVPVILMGDFNAERESPEIKLLTEEKGYVDALSIAGLENGATWDPENNTNINFSRVLPDSLFEELPLLDRLSALYDGKSRRIDFIFLNKIFQPNNVKDGKIFLDKPHNAVFSSDHYGVSAVIEIPAIDTQTERTTQSEFEGLPIASYDTDAGFGYGAKAFFLNQLENNESFDLVLFNSTKGERWYRFVFSMPDFELRQGTVYPFAVDVTIDYDKWISNSFFGVGNRSAYSAREVYTREPLEITAALSRGFTEHSILQAGLRYKTVRNSHIPANSKLIDPSSPLNSSRATVGSLFFVYSYDARDSYINPSRGYVLQGEVEYAPKSFFSNVSLQRVGSTIQYYSTLFYPKTIFAFRTQWQTLGNENIPVQMLLPIGGNRTLRGSPQDRFLDKTSAIVNGEIRFPILWRFGGVLGIDAGKVWNAPSKIDFTRWAANPVAGIRFNMETFIVRLDIGLGHETTGFYLNFGHLF